MATGASLATASSPDFRSAQSRAMVDRLQVVRSLQGGTRAMREMREILLPRHPRESQDHYNGRLASSFLFNVFERAISNMADKPFSSAPSLADGSPDADDFAMNMDGAGADLQTFGRTVLREALRTGVVYVVVDYPRLGQLPSLAAERAVGARPYCVMVRADEVLECRRETIAGRPTITHFRYVSSRMVRDGTFGEKLVRTIMVLEAGKWQEWSDEAAGGWAMVGTGTMSISRVPVVEFRPGELDHVGLPRSPFEDLAWKNVEHWQSSSDQRNILKYGRFPMLAAKGYKPKMVGNTEQPLEIGPSKILVTPPEGEFYYVEPEGKAISAGEDDLTRIEAQMEYLALRPRVDKRSLITATGAAIEEVDENNVVKALAMGLSNYFENVFVLAGEWLGQDWNSLTVQLTGDFEVSSDRAQSVETILRLLDGGMLSPKSALEELRTLGVFRSRFDIESELKEIEKLKAEREALAEKRLKAKQEKSLMGLRSKLPGQVPSNTGIE